MSKLKVLDLFSGIGGFSLGLERTGGFETVAFCEIEPFCQKVLNKHWPFMPIYEDVRDVTGEQLRKDGISVDVVTGGFPCQDLSTAGKQKGIEAERSGLWSELARIISEVRPRYAIVENVAALISGERGRWFGRVLGDLAEIGYDAEWHCIPASEIGAHHHRDRVWIVAYPNSAQCEGGRVSGRVRQTHTDIERGSMCGSPLKNVARPIGLRQQRQGEYVEPLFTEALKKWKAINAESGCISEIWKTEPELGRVADGIPDRAHRLKGLGNSVVPQIPEMIGYAILEAEA